MMIKTSRFFVALVFLLVSVFYADAQTLWQDTLPDYMLTLRDAVYSQNFKSASAVLPLYKAAVAGVKLNYTGVDQKVMLSHCDFYMGRVYELVKNHDKALEFMQRGYDEAKAAIAEQETADADVMLAYNNGELCVLKGRGFMLTHGLDGTKYCERALKLNPNHAAARYLIATRYAFAPGIFANQKKAVSLLMENLENGVVLSKEDLFNTYGTLAYSSTRSGDKAAAEKWLKKALALYPTNKFLEDRLAGKTDKFDN
jgi:tetratricopeptide (TPR) repeat protein